MRKNKIRIIALALVLSVILTGAGASKNNPRLKMSDHSVSFSWDYIGKYKNYTIDNDTKISEEASTKRTMNNGKITYLVPPEFEGILFNEEEKGEMFLMDSEECEAYRINALTGEDAAEVLCVFYFDSDRFLKYETDKKEIRGMERAIIENITPGQQSWLERVLPGALINDPFDSEYFDGRLYEHFVAIYGSHKVEYVFTPVIDGLLVMMYIYLDEPSFPEDVIYMLSTVEG